MLLKSLMLLAGVLVAAFILVRFFSEPEGCADQRGIENCPVEAR